MPQPPARFSALVLLLVGCVAIHARSAAARALIEPEAAGPSSACQAAIASTELRTGIPRGLLGAIGIAESGRFDPATGRVMPWPWSINVAGEDRVFATKDEAIAAVRVYQAQGVRSIDVGCVQVNLMYHPTAFASLDEAFEPATNVAYGGQFLRALYGTAGDWSVAAGYYHSQTPELAEPYRQRVVALWTGVKAPPPVAASLNTNADIYGNWPPRGTAFAAMPPAGFAFRCCNGPAAVPSALAADGRAAAFKAVTGRGVAGRPVPDARPPAPVARPELAQSGTLRIAAPAPLVAAGSSVTAHAGAAISPRPTRLASR